MGWDRQLSGVGNGCGAGNVLILVRVGMWRMPGQRRILEHLNIVGKSELESLRETGTQLNKSYTCLAVSLSVPSAEVGAGKIWAESKCSRFHVLCSWLHLTTVFPSQPAAFTGVVGLLGSSLPTESPTSRNLLSACSSPSSPRTLTV